ncbi:Transport protein [Lysobacter dokdonensis DS-58]|uniref:Transport protein n=1 Tax=Lysobacter dokdonensis DS-58 TaxID=1300345 RepID=A0A0A2WGW1_9GAMM|nr:AI-2E family transporter [Lysobacter dokdonensis]KGQ17947.1 Transport protein [Lysobacter dokdonensis DS-58]
MSFSFETGTDEQPPAPPRPRSTNAAIVLAVLAVAYTLYVAQDLLLPVLLAMFFALVGNPIIRGLKKLWVPRFVSALLVLGLGMFGTYMLGKELIQPGAEWIREVPNELRGLAPKLRSLTKPVTEANRAAENIARAAGGETGTKVQVVKTEVNDPYRVLTATPRVVASVLAVVLLTFFFMVYGGDLQRNAIALLPGRQQKKLTVEILHAIETEISRYVLTISIINVIVGLVFAGLLYVLLDLPADEALLWGTMAGLLNFAPYVGPLIGICVMLVMGFVSYGEQLDAFAPAALYLGLHTLEGQIVTPIVLGRRMALSPLVLILALMVFGWLWGIIGLLLAVPLLVCVKLVLARIDGLEGWAKLLE